MTNKNFIHIAAILIYITVTGLIFSGCSDVLNEHDYSSVPVKKFYKNTREAQLALNGVYQTFWNVYKDNIWYDLTAVPGGTLISNGKPNQYDKFAWTVSDSHLQSEWERLYTSINRANTLLDGLKKSDIPDSASASIMGQAKFLRALSYFDLVQLFGGVPLQLHGTTDSTNVDKPRSSAKEIYQRIEQDLQNSAKELSPYDESAHQAGKATSGAARALLAKVYAQQQNWTEAASTAKKVMDMGVFGLDKDYEHVLDPAYNNNKAAIFSIQHGQGGPNSNLANHNVFQFGPPQTTLKNGTNIEFFHISRTVLWQVDSTFFARAPDTYRKWQTMRKKMPFYYKVGSNKLIRDTVALRDPYIVKYYHLNVKTGDLMTNVNTPIIRYSDVLLTYAEATNEANGGPTPAAYQAINKVRARARGVGTNHQQPKSIYPPLSGLNQGQFRDSVLVEEAREFIGEGHRRADLLRHNRFISNAQKRGIDAKKYQKLYPIPTEEIGRNGNLKQNPGY